MGSRGIQLTPPAKPRFQIVRGSSDHEGNKQMAARGSLSLSARRVRIDMEDKGNRSSAPQTFRCH